MHIIYVWQSELFVDLFAGSVTSVTCSLCVFKTSKLGSGARGVRRCLQQLDEDVTVFARANTFFRPCQVNPVIV